MLIDTIFILYHIIESFYSLPIQKKKNFVQIYLYPAGIGSIFDDKLKIIDWKIENKSKSSMAEWGILNKLFCCISNWNLTHSGNSSSKANGLLDMLQYGRWIYINCSGLNNKSFFLLNLHYTRSQCIHCT